MKVLKWPRIFIVEEAVPRLVIRLRTRPCTLKKLFPIVEAMQKHFSDTIFFLSVAMHHIMSTGKGCLS
uniref:Uncharacterized protein n=1 Tax=Salmo trutta TaxID=8032 RepID=A0A673YJD0_SALTR